MINRLTLMKLREAGVGAHQSFAVEFPACGVEICNLLSLTIDCTTQSELPARLGIFSRNCGIVFMKTERLLHWPGHFPGNAPKSRQKFVSKACNAVMRATANMMEELCKLWMYFSWLQFLSINVALGNLSLDNKAEQKACSSFFRTEI